MSPSIMKVAVPRSQHSPMLGQWASSHTVCNCWPRISAFNSMYRGLPGALTFNHSGSLGLGVLDDDLELIGPP